MAGFHIWAMAFDSPVVFFAILIIVIGVPYVILVALDRLGMFGSKPTVEEQRKKQEAKQAKS